MFKLLTQILTIYNLYTSIRLISSLFNLTLKRVDVGGANSALARVSLFMPDLHHVLGFKKTTRSDNVLNVGCKGQIGVEIRRLHIRPVTTEYVG